MIRCVHNTRILPTLLQVSQGQYIFHRIILVGKALSIIESSRNPTLALTHVDSFHASGQFSELLIGVKISASL